jgi:DNA replication and repair protein RecF
MYLSQLSLNQFKNYPQSTFRFSPKINVLFGKNGAGKTNVLDAIYYLSITKSYFNSVDHQQILQGEQYFVLEAVLNRDDISEKLRLIFQRGLGKKLLINNNELQKFSEHIGAMPVVMIAPGDIQLIYEGSEERRKFVDLIISQCDKVYLYELMQYQKTVDQRNKLLKDFFENRYFNRDLLEVYNEQLGKCGTYIYRARLAFLDVFKPLFLENYKTLSGTNEEPDLVFESDLNRHIYPDLLVLHEQADVDLLRTTRGIHKDDLVFILQHNPLKKFGSQGQQKSFIISLKLAQFQYLEKMKGVKPLLLLDDIFEKLDQTRLQELFKWIANGDFGQIFITDTQKERSQVILGQIAERPHYFEIGNGTILNEIKEEDLI